MSLNLQPIKGHSCQSHLNMDPTGIVLAGPVLELDCPHGRERIAP